MVRFLVVLRLRISAGFSCVENRAGVTKQWERTSIAVPAGVINVGVPLGVVVWSVIAADILLDLAVVSPWKLKLCLFAMSATVTRIGHAVRVCTCIGS